MEAVRACGEGWYYFEVRAVSNSEIWRDGRDWTPVNSLFHYIPDPRDPEKNRTLFSAASTTSPSGVYRVKWTLDNQSRTLTIRSPLPEGEPILVASYDPKGRFIGVQTVLQNKALNLSRADSARMFWMAGGTFHPQARASTVIAGSGTGS